MLIDSKYTTVQNQYVICFTSKITLSINRCVRDIIAILIVKPRQYVILINNLPEFNVRETLKYQNIKIQNGFNVNITIFFRLVFRVCLELCAFK